MSKGKKQNKLGLMSLVLMILTAIFGFGNTTVAYDQMGYASIIWYIFGALVFFLPVSLMFAEYGSTFSSAKGGIYSWLKESIGERLAFIGTFIWLSSWIIWMISTSSKVWIPFSNIIFGTDKTQTWHLFGIFTPMQTIGILGMAWILIITLCATHGFDSIAKIANIGGVLSIALPLIFAILSVIVWVLNKGQLAEPVNGAKSFIQSPNPLFVTPIAIMSFVVYAIFAYGGMESIGGVVDKVKNPTKTFPRGVIIAAIIMAVIYSGSIFLVGITANWHSVVGKSSVNLGNITYVLMNNLGYVFAKTFGFSAGSAMEFGRFMARVAGLGMFIPYLGSFFVLIYSPIKSFIEGSNPDLWPKKVVQLNKHGMPGFAMWIQAFVVVAVIFVISFSGNNAQQFYLILTDMANISTTFPYLFLVGAFPFFKKLKNVPRPFVFYKNQIVTNIMVAIILIVLVLGIGFTAVQPILIHDYTTAFWTIAGPITFALVGWIMYEYNSRHSKKVAKKQ
ncbi:glutamate/gamma-aminobutyrate family transporter YjeM [Fructilactobacillus fructivorans]|uniref:Putative amino acid permease n=1 Tax=Fructilactobacillus fructivorans TaxID=1614 RepID=A0A0C1PQK5_9LACO|nr:glutamate/gamma-aminobutyrate family transporter YjeM [Fructilactobacillus fructivorans]KID42176.1 putative amino acid permease [Fructilactobacillus fructivorans]MCT0152069.1 glutamate/gamma-aminobutyrate family transporter YjeM [Fructilactobacillus fructivorans]MCT2867961.1 glutamate/gamma-aminobutyrate family transporter YjeM [Fructilactobacillus fructivorans]MCT2868457.1 glutamate/gamma-aminobutyrate family transporter YjeM [Fructilactobacillus fructivorans]MCT2873457.1 glutamate/gamma-a